MPEVHCPNCGQPTGGTPVACSLCGYRSEMAREYFWLYLGGGTLILAGLGGGMLGVLLEGSGPAGWSRPLAEWFPLGPWPASYHWLAFIIEGILLTLIGMGITRRFRTACWALAALALWDGSWAVRSAVIATGESEDTALRVVVIAWNIALLALALRIGWALRRTPPRDARRLQAGALERQNATKTRRPAV